MAAKPFGDRLREAVLRSGKSRYRISRETGITESQLSRFVNGNAGLNLASIDKLCACIGARLAVAKPVKRTARKRK